MDIEKSLLILGLFILGSLVIILFYSMISVFLIILNLPQGTDLTPEARQMIFVFITTIISMTIISAIYNLLDKRLSLKSIKKVSNQEHNDKSTFFFVFSYLLACFYVFFIAYGLVFLPTNEYIQILNPFSSSIGLTLFFLLNLAVGLAILGFIIEFHKSKTSR